MKNLKNMQSDAALMNLLRNYLEYNGLLFPTTAGALAAVEDKLKKTPDFGPVVPLAASDILRNGKIKIEVAERIEIPLRAQQFRAAAARNGNDIPEEIRAKMQKDRKQAENQKPENESI